ncbi:MAG: ABC transporter transmembrane domain-containing protein [Hydrogenophaga sp.]|uniref:ABC transporter transmembrane domain-containing protein n=1 Tax=Hydrogenophaga sp. TaxID=1904254 RepID=UPI002AB8F890|nr:ABC transporter transmembrane domain-containing protein [Hydrogenophaga sp.]MDZ4103966.1 ABC transporter transmembrane domain-containing protein [Hydrogenophaga sp.]
MTSHHIGGLTPALSTEDAVWLLGSLAGLHRKPFDAELLIKRFAPPWDLPTLIEALAGLGLKAQPAPWPDPSHPPPPFPVVAFARSTAQDAAGPPLLIASRNDGQLGLFRPRDAPRELNDLHVLSPEVQPWLLLCAVQDPAAPADSDEDSTTSPAQRPGFGFSWFIPELLRHRRLWRDVLLASLAIQLVGLATPLFTQVIIDKVIAHHSVSTLWVLGVALVVFMLFTSAMTWLRQYLVLHTGSRMDAVLGEQVMRHLLRLPLPYFEARPTGTLVARLQGVETLREFVSGAAVTLLLDLPFLFIFLAVMFWYSWVLSLVAVGLLLLIVGVSVSVVMVPVFRQRLSSTRATA